MKINKFLIIIILVGAYTYIMINYPTDLMKSLGYNQVLDFYACQVSSRSSIDIIYNPGLRKLDMDKPLDKLKIRAVIPNESNNYRKKMEQIQDVDVIVECSGLDCWHTFDEGQTILRNIRDHMYRVVVFDGGHHLATLGMSPDIIIVPVMAGYAVHTYMLDGIKVDTLKKLVADNKLNSIIVTVPRWALVKNENSLKIITRKILDECRYKTNENETFELVCKPRVSKTGKTIFAYVNKEYINNIDLLINNCKCLGIRNLDSIYLAFDYRYINQSQTVSYLARMEKALQLPVKKVNDPVKTFNVFWGGK